MSMTTPDHESGRLLKVETPASAADVAEFIPQSTPLNLTTGLSARDGSDFASML
jgi:hypothetical protein